MKKGLLVTAWLLIAAMPVLACTSCGCSGGGTTLGMQLVTVRNYAGMIWQHTGLTVYEQGELHSSFASDTWQVYGSLQLPGKWHMQARLPLVWNRVTDHSPEGDQTESLFAAGDLNLIAGYQAMTLRSGRARHTLFVQAGAELPTGKYKADFVQAGLPPGFYPGSASIDPLAGIQYILSDSAWTAMFGASVKYSLPNADHLQEGLFWQAQTVVARSLGASGRWVPFAGLVAEHRNGYRKYDFLNEESAYSVAHGMAGMEYRGDRFSVGARIDHTIWQQYSTEETTNNGAYSVYVNWFF